LKSEAPSIVDHSIKRESANWKSDAEKRIGRAYVVIVICGRKTNTATGVTEEIEIARRLGVNYRLLRGRKSGPVRRPKGTFALFDPIHDWTWAELRRMTDPRPWWKRIW
jgi:hypothetical protein